MAAAPGAAGGAAGLPGPLHGREQPGLEGTPSTQPCAPRQPGAGAAPSPAGLIPQVLQVPRAARGQVLDLRPGARYRAQVRARPVGPRYRGSWSAWSEPVAVDASPDAGKGRGRGPGAGGAAGAGGAPVPRPPLPGAGWVVPSATLLPLGIAGALLGLRCAFPALCR